MKGRTTVWPPLVGGGRWVKWRGSNPRANQQMVSSKGTAGVSRASLVVVAATLPVFGIPENAMLLIMGIDVFLDMGRTATNVIGNSLATSAVAKWEGKLGEEVRSA